MLKQTKEFFIFLAAIVAGTVASLADKKFGFGDITNYIQAFLTGQDGIAGADEIPGELMAATPEAKRETFQDLETKLAGGGLSEADAYDVAAIMAGAGSGIALGGRLTRRTITEKLATLANEGTITINGPLVATGGVDGNLYTPEDMERLLTV